MNANAFRHFYDYHFTENRKIWGGYVTPLFHEQFTQSVNYSHGSVRDQIVHLMSVDDTWFSGWRGVEIPESLNPANFWKAIIWQQFGAAIDMLDNALRACPDELWRDRLWDTPSERPEYSQFWYLVFHTLQYAPRSGTCVTVEPDARAESRLGSGLGSHGQEWSRLTRPTRPRVSP